MAKNGSRYEPTQRIIMVTDTKTIKNTRFFNQNENKGMPSSWNKKKIN